MTDLDHEANEAARHGNREALEAMTARCERLEARLVEMEVERDKLRHWNLCLQAQKVRLMCGDLVEEDEEARANVLAALSDKGDG